MSTRTDLQTNAEKLADTAKATGNKIKDTLSEATHRGAAEVEHRKREMLGSQMTVGEKAKSVAEEAKHTIQADVDAVKKKLDDA